LQGAQEADEAIFNRIGHMSFEVKPKQLKAFLKLDFWLPFHQGKGRKNKIRTKRSNLQNEDCFD
jgi:hypothetical protein